MMDKNINIVKYKNGNYIVMLNLNDGTMIRYTKEDELRPKFPDSMDIKITNRCYKGCPYCHEKSTKDGLHGDLLSKSFIDSLHPYTQIACGGGDIMTHPDLEEFLYKCQKLKLIPSITVNQTHFMQNIPFIQELSDKKLIYGIGISLNHANKQFINAAKSNSNIVVHVINGIVTKDELESLAHHNLKILILGYKNFGRGTNYLMQAGEDIKANQAYIQNTLPRMIEEKWFQNISFDNLALQQIDVKSLLTPEEWNNFYMGEDGRSTMYVDMVKQEFAASSTSIKRYPLQLNIEDMLKVIHQEKGLSIG